MYWLPGPRFLEDILAAAEKKKTPRCEFSNIFFLLYWYCDCCLFFFAAFYLCCLFVFFFCCFITIFHYFKTLYHKNSFTLQLLPSFYIKQKTFSLESSTCIFCIYSANPIGQPLYSTSNFCEESLQPARTQSFLREQILLNHALDLYKISSPAERT